MSTLSRLSATLCRYVQTKTIRGKLQAGRSTDAQHLEDLLKDSPGLAFVSGTDRSLEEEVTLASGSFCLSSLSVYRHFQALQPGSCREGTGDQCGQDWRFFFGFDETGSSSRQYSEALEKDRLRNGLEVHQCLHRIQRCLQTGSE